MSETKPPTRPDHRDSDAACQESSSGGAVHGAPAAFAPRPFDHQRLDAYRVACEALRRGDALAKKLPHGYGKLADQLRRALLSAHLGIAEAANRCGADRLARYRAARGEAAESAAALEAVLLLGLGQRGEVEALLVLVARLCAMLTRLCYPRPR